MITNYEQSFTVHRYECDMHSRMLPAAILRRAQQLSTDHCDTHGLTPDIYEKTKTAFLLAKSLLNIIKPIVYGMQVTMKTEAYAPLRAVYCRTISFYNGQELLARTDSRWILIDITTKRIMRHPPQEIEQFFPQTLPGMEAFSVEKIDTEKITDITAQFSMCDINRHINNTVYADIVCNNIPTHELEQKAFKTLILTYHSEIPYNTCFELQRGITAEKGYYFIGKSNGTNHFEANVILI